MTLRLPHLTLTYIILALVLCGVPAFFAHAAEHNKDDTRTYYVIPIIPSPSVTVPQASNTENSMPATTSAQIPVDSTDTTTNNTTTNTSRTEATSTRPLTEPVVTPTVTTTTPVTAPRNGDLINPAAEDILNEIVTPGTPAQTQPIPLEDPDQTVTQPKKTPPKVTTPKKPQATSTTSTSTSATTTATTEQDENITPIGGIINSIIEGATNNVSPENYYYPLDRLSTEATYGLSAIAAVLGIAGVALILRAPNTLTEEEEAWVGIGYEPRFRPRQSLLEP